MPKKDVLNVAVVSENLNDGKIMLSSIVAAIVRNVLTVNDNEIEASMCDEGKELLSGSERIAESLLASNRADAFSLKKALIEANSISDNMTIAFRCNDTFCGRVHFQCLTADKTDECRESDAVLFIADENKIADSNVQIGKPVVIAVKTEKFHGKAEIENGIESYISQQFLNAIEEHGYAAYWYNPLGFDNEKINSIEEAAPYGVEQLFVKLMNYAAEYGQSYYRKIIAYSQKMVSMRRSVFQKKSPRRVLELEDARKRYSYAVNSIYGIEQLLTIMTGKLTKNTDRKE